MSKTHSNSGKSVKERLLNLSRVIKSTFANRETGYRENHPLFTEDFFTAKDRQTFWNGFLRKIKYQEKLDFPTVGKLIREKLSPYWQSMK